MHVAGGTQTSQLVPPLFWLSPATQTMDEVDARLAGIYSSFLTVQKEFLLDMGLAVESESEDEDD